MEGGEKGEEREKGDGSLIPYVRREQKGKNDRRRGKKGREEAGEGEELQKKKPV
jgi:hypothetical protein